MLDQINEPIDIIVKFAGTKVTPIRFLWRAKTYDITTINLIHTAGAGEDKMIYFSVSDDTNFFRLAFSTKDLSWRLEELYFDG